MLRNIFKYYMVSIHRFVENNIKTNSVDNTIFVVFFLTATFFLIWVESFTNLNLIHGRLSVMIFGIPVFLVCLPLSFWYDKNSATAKQLNDGKDQYTGIILFIISLLLVAFFRKW